MSENEVADLLRQVDELQACLTSQLQTEGRLRKELREMRAELDRLRRKSVEHEIQHEPLAYKCDTPQPATQLAEEGG